MLNGNCTVGARMKRHAHGWLMAIRDSYIILLPLTLFGAAAELFQHFPWPGYTTLMAWAFGEQWMAPLQAMVQATQGIYGLVIAVLVAIHLTLRLPVNDSGDNLPPMLVGMSAMVNFVMCILAVSGTSLKFGHSSVLVGILIGGLSTELLRLAVKIRWVNKAPYESDIIVYHTLRLTPAILLIGALLVGASLLVKQIHFSEQPIADLIDTFQHSGAGFWLNTLLASVINQVVWFVGVHGGHLIDSFFPQIFGSPEAGLASRTLITSMVLIGGSGATLGLILAIFIATQEGQQYKVARLSLIPSLFNINEVILFGLPVIWSPLYLIPFLLIPQLLTILALSAVSSGFISLHNLDIPWSTPPIISGLLITESWRGAFLQVIAIGISALVYLPFVRKAEAIRRDQHQQLMSKATHLILTGGRERKPVIRRHDQIGVLARGLLRDLCEAMNKSQLTLAYQPKHDIQGQVVGMEALLRWEHSRHGAISPALAVALAEDSGDIRPLGLWVLREACACKARMNRKNRQFKKLSLSINVSPLQLTDPELPATLLRSLERYDLRPEEIELEITESSALPETPEADDALAKLAASGVLISLDDFGMGYASLMHLRRFRVGTIKIDGSLTRDVLKNETNADIIRSITTLGHSRQVDVVAEFVETSDQREALIRLGCTLFQGYFHSRPLYENDFMSYCEGCWATQEMEMPRPAKPKLQIIAGI
ncbi:PTS sugar transporter subunit IIC/EAL domain-containing protein [Pokkaliibacter sp. CJK22405]|uniref:PTS sugar transporter subunit IIC/EAL domain-containing protein n=1 Tax=Pokkaliibacter sp. CJK22405 TaxID=3384615 RepID=UPI0039848D3B